MKKILTIFIFSSLLFQVKARQEVLSADLIKIETKNTVLVYRVDAKNKVQQVYYGQSIANGDYNSMTSVNADIYPGFGSSYVNEPALRVVHADGNTSTDLIFNDYSVKTIADGITQTIIHTTDSYFPFKVDLCFKAYFDDDIIQQWVEISNGEKKDIVLHNYASSHLFLSDPKYYLTQFYGNWANEMNMKESELTRGQKVLDSKLGVRADQYSHPCFLLSPGTPSQENSGSVIGGTLAWPGSWNITFDVDHLNDLHIISGINSFAGQYLLKPEEIFKTPALLFSYSDEGTGKITRSFHSWATKYGIYKGDRLRTTLLNNWEATYFDFNEEVLSGIIKDASDMGFELFLLDDGWFGNKYPRNNDDAGLGDWEVNRKKLPNGLGYLVEESKKQGIKFGIWLEPEMVNPKSELFEKHPDWVIGQPNRALDLSRNQLILDLTNPKVQDYVYRIIDQTLTETPGIAYIKWDCNRFVTNSGSWYLSPETQSHLWIGYVRGLFVILDKVRTKYKDISLMVCSGGGGRIDYGSLPYFDEFWISDNTDALDRIFIQWGTTYFFPSMALASHVSVVPNHITGRTTPLKFRFDVAMSAKLGMDLQPKDLSPKDKLFCKNAIQEYYSIRGIIQFGDLYRLLSPYTNSRTAMMYVGEDKKEAVVFSYLLKKQIYGNNQPLNLQGLDENKMYKLTEVNKDPDNYSWFTELEGKVYSGEFLMKYGIRFPMYNEFDSKIIRLTAQ